VRKRLVIGVAGVVAACALACTSASAELPVPLPFTEAGQLAITPDGRNAYVGADHGTLALARDPDTGALRLLDWFDRGAASIEISPDGKFVYGSGDGLMGGVGITATRRQADGKLSFVGSWNLSGMGASDIEISPDGNQLYATAEHGVAIFDRNVSSGALTFRRVATPPSDQQQLEGVTALTLSHNGKFLYAGSNFSNSGVSTFSRTTGGDLASVAFMDSGTCFCTIGDLEIAPDGYHVLFGANGMIGPGDGQVVVAPDGKVAYATDPEKNRIRALTVPPAGSPRRTAWDWNGAIERDPGTGALAPAAATPVARLYHEGEDGMRGIRWARTLTLSPDGKFLYVSGERGGWQSLGTIAVLRRDPATDRVSFASLFDGPEPPLTAWDDILQINDGDEYTNDRHVTLSMHRFPFGDAIDFSNDAGYAHPDRRKRNFDDTYEWELASTGPDKLRKTVYARVLEGMGTPAATFWPTMTDDIVLDEAPPEVVEARLLTGGERLAVSARDRISGVAKLQVTDDRKHPGSWRKYRRKGTYEAPSKRPYVRVRDRAGNRSVWRRVGG
jgi:hypothetical protein